MATSGQIQPLKIPDAVVALAQAAAKVNGETEKCMSCREQVASFGGARRTSGTTSLLDGPDEI
jgi:hypothetical protein